MGKKKSLDKGLRKCWHRVVKKHEHLSSKLNSGRLGALEVKVAHSASEWRQVKAALGREHGLGAGREAGDRLCHLVREDGRVVAVLVWCAAGFFFFVCGGAGGGGAGGGGVGVCGGVRVGGGRWGWGGGAGGGGGGAGPPPPTLPQQKKKKKSRSAP